MAVAFETYTTATADYAGSTGNLSVNPPSGLTAGNLWLISTGMDIGTGPAVGLASGFSSVSAAIQYNDVTTNWPWIRSQWKAAGSSESAVTVPFTNVYRVHAISQRWSGANTSAPIGNVNRGDDAGGTATETVTPGSVSVADNGSAVVAVVGFYPTFANPVVTITPSSGYASITTMSGASHFTALNVAYKLCDAGTETPGAIQCAVDNGFCNTLIAQVFEIRVGAVLAGVPTYGVSRPWLDDVIDCAPSDAEMLRGAQAWF